MNQTTSSNTPASGSPLVIERRWFSFSALGTIIFGVVWNVFLVFYAIQTLTAETQSEEAILIIPLAIVGLVAGYLALAAVLNRSTITVDDQTIGVRHHPLPWRNRAFETGQVQQVFVKRHTSGQQGRNRRHHFSVQLLMPEGKHRLLVGSMSNANEAADIKRAIEQRLGIEPHPVEGEYSGW